MEFETIFKSVKFDNFTTTHGLLLLLSSIISWVLFRSLASGYGNGRKSPPGPVGLPLLGYLPFLGKEPHKKLWKMREKYGDIIGLYMGPKYTVILNEFSVMKEVLCHPAALDRAPNLFDHIPRCGFIAENGEKWIEQRRFCLSTARDLGLGRGHWEDLIMEEASSFTEKLQTFKGKPVDVSQAISASISSNIVSLLIGRRLKKDEEADKIQLAVEYADVSFTFMGPSNPTSVIPGLRKFCESFKIAGYDRALGVIRQFSDFIRQEISLHKTSAALSDIQDFMNIYLEKLKKVTSENGKHYFSETMLEGNVSILFLGASDTIISSMGWLLRLMAKHKDIQERVYKELIEVVGKEGRARYEERQKIPYTFAVILEAQRFSSIVPLSTTRRANQDIRIKDYVIPKGAEIVANLWALHNDPAYWENPEEFRPERFLYDDDSKIIKQLPSFAPFSLGRRNCIGETIAYMEILFYFSEIMKNLEVSTEPGVEPEFKIINGLVAHLEPQPLCFKKRTQTF